MTGRDPSLPCHHPDRIETTTIEDRPGTRWMCPACGATWTETPEYVTRPWPGMTSERLEFLLARIAEDEEAIRYEIDHDADHDVTRWGSSRVLAECQAKHDRVGLIARLSLVDPEMAAELLNIELVPYADHPDYRQEWRP